MKRIVDWIVEVVFPFTVLQRLGEEFEDASRGLRVGMGICCAVIIMAASGMQPDTWKPISPQFPIGWGWIVGMIAGIAGAWKAPEAAGKLLFWLNRALATLTFAITLCVALGGLAYLGAMVFSPR